MIPLCGHERAPARSPPHFGRKDNANKTRASSEKMGPEEV